MIGSRSCSGNAGKSRQILPSEETSRRWRPAGIVLKRTGNVSTAPRIVQGDQCALGFARYRRIASTVAVKVSAAGTSLAARASPRRKSSSHATEVSGGVTDAGSGVEATLWAMRSAQKGQYVRLLVGRELFHETLDLVQRAFRHLFLHLDFTPNASTTPDAATDAPTLRSTGERRCQATKTYTDRGIAQSQPARPARGPLSKENTRQELGLPGRSNCVAAPLVYSPMTPVQNRRAPGFPSETRTIQRPGRRSQRRKAAPRPTPERR